MPESLPKFDSCKPGDPGQLSHPSELTLVAVTSRARCLMGRVVVSFIECKMHVKRLSPFVTFCRGAGGGAGGGWDSGNSGLFSSWVFRW